MRFCGCFARSVHVRRVGARSNWEFSYRNLLPDSTRHLATSRHAELEDVKLRGSTMVSIVHSAFTDDWNRRAVTTTSHSRAWSGNAVLLAIAARTCGQSPDTSGGRVSPEPELHCSSST